VLWGLGNGWSRGRRLGRFTFGVAALAVGLGTLHTIPRRELYAVPVLRRADFATFGGELTGGRQRGDKAGAQQFTHQEAPTRADVSTGGKKVCEDGPVRTKPSRALPANFSTLVILLFLFDVA
jgi:hypothetical protein